MNLAERLRTETRDLHVQAERSDLMRRLLQGLLPRAEYCQLLCDLHVIYAELESGLVEHCHHRLLAPIHDARLARADALAMDLDTLRGPDWVLQMSPSPTAVDYAGHLAELAATDPGLLLAHAYVRYLGDLSGGQILRGIVRRSMQPDGDGGTRFYEFAPADPQALAHRFRAGLESIEPDPVLAAQLSKEARSAFGRHIRMFEQAASSPLN